MESKPKLSKRELKNKLRLLNAGSFTTLAKAINSIESCGRTRYTASGVTITIKDLSDTDNIIVEEFMITDGLSDESIKALKNDLISTYKYKKSMIPHIKEDN